MKHEILKQFIVFFFLPFAICVLLYSCKDKSDTLDIDYKLSYLPLDTGKYLVYDVDSIFSYNTNFTRDTVHYQLKELVADTLYDNTNELNYRIELYRRQNSSLPWTIDRVWTAKKTAYNIQKDEDNIRFIKLVFPPAQGKTWDGNLYVPTTDPYRDFKNWNYHYENVDVRYSINGFNFDSTLLAVDVNDSTFIDKHLRKEIYAKHIGKIYEEYEIKTKQYPDSWDTGRWNGFSIKMKLIDHN